RKPKYYSSEEEAVEDEEVDEKEMAQMCFMAHEEVSSIFDSDDDDSLDLEEVLEEMKNLMKKNAFQKGKILKL
ncbi:hypothetical protein, partial [Heyndrickxia coagulans]|uniref:hypothetical protein n=1 Tax=Heyndrickxia coagulans TaxID=1398 RepID=UPI00214DE2D5